MPELLHAAVAIDVLGRQGEPSATVSWEGVARDQADVQFIACCGFDIERTRVDLDRVRDLPEWQGLPAVAQGRVFLADVVPTFRVRPLD